MVREVLIINGAAVPTDGVDVKAGQERVELIYKNDSWQSPGGWSGELCSWYREGSGGSFVARDDWATNVLKSGNVGNLGGYGFGDTLPHPSRFEQFARRAANFVSSSFGCGIWSIANEPTLERARGVPITPELYRDAFIQVRDAIKSVRPGAQVITAGMVQGDFEFFEQTMRLLEGQTDGIAIHSYTNANYWHEGNFNSYQGLMERIPISMRHLPVYMTEAGNGGSGPYPDHNHGFIELMFRNIHDWNQTPGNHPIRSVNFYRWLSSDQWGIETKPGMIDDFLTAMDEPFYWRQP